MLYIFLNYNLILLQKIVLITFYYTYLVYFGHYAQCSGEVYNFPHWPMKLVIIHINCNIFLIVIKYFYINTCISDIDIILMETRIGNNNNILLGRTVKMDIGGKGKVCLYWWKRVLSNFWNEFSEFCLLNLLKMLLPSENNILSANEN